MAVTVEPVFPPQVLTWEELPLLTVEAELPIGRESGPSAGIMQRGAGGCWTMAAGCCCRSWRSDVGGLWNRAGCCR